MVLKPPVGTSEKGVIALKYTPNFECFAALFDHEKLTQHYRIVFEPSSYRNIEPSLFLFASKFPNSIFEAAHADDRVILDRLQLGIQWINLGSGDWTNSELFKPDNSVEKIYDVIMVAAWSKLKRHNILFAAANELQKRGKSLRLALVGYPHDLALQDIQAMAKSHGVLDQCTFYEKVSYPAVAKLLNESRMAVHLSLAEGTNKASYEAWFSDVPLIVSQGNTGFRNEFINPQTGLISGDGGLWKAIDFVRDNPEEFSPRHWLSSRSGYKKATSELNDALRELAFQNGEDWTVDIRAKHNSPGFSYACENDAVEFELCYRELFKYLRRSRL